ncbi:AAA family ATPase [Nostoc sp. UHCC 0870]|uniref:AAA family ATPase n=1 Tax=Nostoc sp. UHCC 0870 TaxID=2914041 RepID=UPI001EE0D34C|nr:AAA family ATPase [Nostoc sp. UHCC 0870]UKO96797.1 AAA family ATPase [Nostoc sp. UHCC 0870]
MLIFEEHFQDNRCSWVTRDSSECSLYMEVGHYVFDHKREGDAYWLSWNSAEFFYDRTDFHIHMVLEKAAGVDDHGYGFIWGLLDDRNFFEFVISGNACYRIAEVKNGSFVNYTDWKRCDRIQRGHAVNLLEICRVGNFVEFYINSTLVDKFPAEKLMDVPGRNFGFVIHDKIKMKVHSLMVSAPDTEKDLSEVNLEVYDSRYETKATFVEHEPPDDDSLELVFADLKALVGHERTKHQLFSLANYLKVQTERQKRGLKTVDISLHLMLYGPPGTGKTTIARLVGRLYKQLGFLERGHVVETDRAGIVSGYIGQTALRVENAVQQALDGVLFIDEAHALAPEDSPNDYGKEALQILIKRMEDHRDRLAVVIAGYTEEMDRLLESNPGFKSRLHRLFYLDHYTPQELLLIFKKFCHDNGYTLDPSANIILQATFELAYVNRDKNFGNGRFARALFERSIEQQANRIVHDLHKLDNSQLTLITAEDLSVNL